MKTVFRTKKFQLVVLLLLAAVAVWAIMTFSSSQSSSAAPGDQAPTFELTNLEGEAVRLSDYKGKGVILNFWASWCNPCVNELPLLNEAFKLADLPMIAINVGEDEEKVRKFVERYDLAFPVALDHDLLIKKKYHASGLPLTVLIDSKGTLIHRHVGELTDMSEILELMQLVN